MKRKASENLEDNSDYYINSINQHDGVDLEVLKEIKRKQNLERNRLAASRCRERKKFEQQQIVEKADYLTLQNESLCLSVRELKNEVNNLRQLLLAHDTCDCQGIKMFIQKSSAFL